MYFDIIMPLTLFGVSFLATLTSGKVEKKLKATFEAKEFKVKDAIILVAMITVAVSMMAFVPRMAIMTLFLLAYSLLLFMFTYMFSDFGKAKAKVFLEAFFVTSFLVATISLFTLFTFNTSVAYGAAALYSLCGFSFVAIIYEEDRQNTKERWYSAIMPPVLFVTLYIFFSKTPIWFPYLLDMYGLIFAVLIILYLGSLFSWKTSIVFAVLLTAADIILVLVTGAMVSAATQVVGLRLPVLVVLPTFPPVVTEEGMLYMSLGLGDFFFSGLLAVQTYKKFGKRIAFLSAVAMAISFFIFEMFILTFNVRAFPGTLMIISGWAPMAFLTHLKAKI